MRLSIIVPVYNEQGTIATALARVLAVDLEKEIIVVDDGSTDGTAEGDFVINQGKGAAVRTGLAKATGDFHHPGRRP